MKKILLLILSLLLLPGVLAASATISQSGADSGTVMKGEAFALTVDGLESSGTVSINPPAGFSIPEEDKVQSFSEGTTSVSFTTLTATEKMTSQTLTAQVSITGSPTTATTSAFNVILPPSIDVTATPSSENVTGMSSFDLSVDVQNSGETTAKGVSASISLPTGLTTSDGSEQSIGEIAASASSSVGWTISVGTPSASSNIIVTISASNADSESVTIPITYDTAPGGGNNNPSGGSNSGGSGGAATQSNSTKQSWTKITPGNVSIMHLFDDELGLKQISITVNNPAQQVSITVTKYDGLPANVSVAKTGKVYKYLQVDSENLSDKLANANLSIKVKKSWLSQNGLLKEQIALFHYDELNHKWNELPTTYTGSEGAFENYEATSQSFSYFAIAEKTSASGSSTEAAGNEGGSTTGQTGTTSQLTSGTSEPKNRTMTYVFIIIGIVILLIVIFAISMKRKIKTEEHNHSN